MRRLIGGLGFRPPEPSSDPITVSWVWVGNVSHEGATVKARSSDASSITLRYGTDPGLDTYDAVSGVEGGDGVWAFDVPSLDPATRYHYAIPDSSAAGSFRTLPTPGSPYSFGLALASCAGSGGDYRVGAVSDSVAFEAIAARMASDDVIGFAHLGDRGYPNIATDSLAAFRNNYNNNMAMARQRAMHAAGWVDYVPDDHDYGANDSDGTSASRPAALAAYAEHVPSWPRPDVGGFYHDVVIGRTRIIYLDTRTARTPNSATDDASKTMLGTTQKQWFKDTLLAATEPLIAVHVVNPWSLSSAQSSDAWGRFSTERAELSTFFEANDLTDRLYLFHSDAHWVAADDGSHTQFDGSANPGPPLGAFAPLDCSLSSTASAGLYSEGIHTDSRQMYGVLRVVDTGSQVGLTPEAYAVSGGGETEILGLSEIVYPG